MDIYKDAQDNLWSVFYEDLNRHLLFVFTLVQTPFYTFKAV